MRCSSSTVKKGLLAILFIFSIHFVNTHLRPDSFPMDMVVFTGVESEEEFKHKRPLEYERMVKRRQARIAARHRAAAMAAQLLQSRRIHGNLYRPYAAGAHAQRVFQIAAVSR